MRVLVVDDDPAIREVTREIIASAGYHADTASGAVEALERLRAGDIPCLVLLDLRMPGMSGAAFLEEVARMDHVVDMPILIFSAYHDVMPQVEGARVIGRLDKPYVGDELVRAVSEWC